MERQFRNYFEKASKRKGMTGEELLRMLEMRLDNVVYRMGLARSRAEARQLVSHGHFTVNGRPTNIPSYPTKAGDKIEVRESRRGREYFKTASETVKAAQIPDWVSVDAAKLAGSILSEPVREQMPLEFNEQLVVEYYSR
jgi:small subunit ribosomal protein S4